MKSSPSERNTVLIVYVSKRFLFYLSSEIINVSSFLISPSPTALASWVYGFSYRTLISCSFSWMQFLMDVEKTSCVVKEL